MYESYFGLRENPFSLSPDPRFLYCSPQHEEALHHLLYGINERKGFMVIVGGIGTGKTTLCRTLLASLNESVEAALVFNPAVSELELLQTIAQEFRIRLDGRKKKTRKSYIDALNVFLLDTYRAGKNAILLIDEAQNLSHSVLEQIRLLSNLETEREKLLQIVLVGQPELDRTLRLASLRQLRERIVVWYELRPLKPTQVPRYINHRFAVAGGADGLFSLGARLRIFLYSRGNPRRINAVCDRAMLIAYSRDLRRIGSGMVREAVRDVGGGGGVADYLALLPGGRMLWGGIAVALVVLLAVFALRGVFAPKAAPRPPHPAPPAGYDGGAR